MNQAESPTRAERRFPAKVSLALTKPRHVGLVFDDPGGGLPGRELARFGHPNALRNSGPRERALIPASAPAAVRQPQLRFQQGYSWAHTGVTSPGQLARRPQTG